MDEENAQRIDYTAGAQVDEGMVRFLMDCEEDWARIDHALAGEKLQTKPNGETYWLQVVPPLINERGREAIHLYWSGIVGKVLADSALTAEDVQEEAYQLSINFACMLAMDKPDEYEIDPGAFQTIYDACFNPMFHMLRAAQGGGIRTNLMKSTRILEANSQQGQVQPRGRLAGLADLVTGRRGS